MATSKIYVWVEQVPSIPPNVQALWNIIPKNQANEVYVAELCRDTQRPSVVAQRLTALACFSHIMQTVAPHLCDSITLGRHENGKPYALCDKLNAKPISLSFSHIQDMAVCAVSFDVEKIGVDIEHIMPNDRAEKISNRFFTLQEIDMLRATETASGDIVIDATRLWTMKEALFKCGGYETLVRVDVSCAMDMYFSTARIGECLLTLCTPDRDVCVKVLSPTLLSWENNA